MNVDFDGSFERARRRVEGVNRSPAAVPISQLVRPYAKTDNATRYLPEVVWAVFVGHNDYGNLRVRLDWVDAIGSIRKVLRNVRAQAFQCRFSVTII